LYKVGMKQSEFTPVEHALVDDRTQQWVPKNHHSLKQEAKPYRRWGSSLIYLKICRKLQI